MKNLRNIEHLELIDNDGQQPTACAWDVATDSLICAFGPTKDNSLIQLKRWRTSNQAEEEPRLDSIASWESPCPSPDLDCDSILCMKHFIDTSTSCLVLAGGDIVVVRESPFDGEERIEIVGSVDAGISAAAWSPDEELLAVLTTKETFLYMSRDFESITSIKLMHEDLNASKHVDVGWGKKETQFKGKGAKALRDPTMPEKVDKGLSSRNDDGRSTITWRGDGAFVAVNSLQATSRRLIRIFSREGVLDGVSEPVDFLEPAVSWKPSGSIIAGIQRFEHRIDVIFFERNGLRHGQFPLRLKEDEMLDWGSSITLNWNVDSSVLAITFRDRVQLWTMGNYHYYFKQEIKISPGAKPQCPLFSWHPEQALVFAIASGNISRHESVFTISRGSTLKPNDNGIIGVVDGQTLQVTPFRRANVPPPMALHSVQVSSSIIDVAFSEYSDSPPGFAVMTDRTISVFEWNASTKASEPILKFCYAFDQPALQGEGIGIMFNLQQVVYVNAQRLLLLASNGSKSILIQYGVASSQLEFQGRLEYTQIQQLVSGSIQGADTTYLGLRNGSLVSANDMLPLSHQMTSGKALPSILGPLDHTELICLSASDDDEPLVAEDKQAISSIVAISLTRRGFLYAGDRCLSTNCTSFLTTTAHLIFTTSQHLLKFVHIATTVRDLEVPPDTPEADERCRSIERGARLITAIPSTSALVLQMPRGNLETIYPRALVLAEIRDNLSSRKFKKAFITCRNHRVDMNILHDHDPQNFLSHVSEFVEQVQKVEYIDLFLSQLRVEDVSVKMYQETTRRPRNFSNAKIPEQRGDDVQSSKVNRVCNAFLGVLRSYKNPQLQNIITAHCCKVPPDLESGLLEVSKLQKQSVEEAERAVEHICFLVDVNKLYDTALGLYDLDLTLLVAQQSQKDPREYLPFLQELRAQSLMRMKFDIDNHLGRYTRSLKHLQGLDAFEELKAFTIEHSLYEEALALYRHQEENITSIMEIYADYLSNKSRNKEAGLAYEYLKDYAAASEAYRLAHLWQESLSCANLVPLQKDQIFGVAHAIADSLVELKNYHAAATIHLDYLENVESAARLYCKGYFFADATRVLSLNARSDLLGTIVDAGLVEGMVMTTELLADCKAQLGAQIPRIRELRIKKAEEPLAFFDADINGDANIPDNVSLVGTDVSTMGGSMFTRYTNKTGTVASNATRQTSKNRRREERKKARGKKGSVYEEEYLVNSVGRLFERVNSINEEVVRLITGLMRRGMRERAKAVQGSMNSVIKICDECKEEVFGNRAQTPANIAGVATDQPLEPTHIGDSETEGEKSAMQPMEARAMPIVKALGNVSLLGV